MAGTSGAYAADSNPAPGGLLGPLNVKTPENIPLDHYELIGGGDGVIDTVQQFLMSGLFALARTLVGLACWLIDWAYHFPIINRLAGPAQHVSDAYQSRVVAPLGIAPLFLGWAFVFGLILVMRGKLARGFGEIALTLLISAVAATSLVRPDMILGHDGPLQQTQRAALEAASVTAQQGRTQPTGPNDPCGLITGPARDACLNAPPPPAAKAPAPCDVVAGPARDSCRSGPALAAADVSAPITRTLTNTLVVQPYMLLSYGRIVSPGDPLYQAHLHSLDPQADPAAAQRKKACSLLTGQAKQYCENPDAGWSGDHSADAKMQERTQPFAKAGDSGKAAIAYMSHESWERVLGALLVLFAVFIIFLVVLAMVMASLAAQFGCVAAAAVGCVVFAWALLPGPNRSALWKWVGMFAAASVVLFAISVCIPAFGIAADVLLADSQSSLMERLFLLDGLAVTLLAFHRRMLRSAGGIGQRFAARMRFARVGGNLLNEGAASTGMALASLGVGTQHGGGGLALGLSPARASLLGRHAHLAAAVGALGDREGMPGHPAGLLADARAEGRRGLAPLAVTARMAHSAWVGPPRDDSQAPSPGGQGPGPGGGPHRRQPPLVVDSRTGEILSDPTQGVMPIGTRLEERLRRTRGGRILATTGRLAFNSTIGAPATWTRARHKSTRLTQAMGRQLTHYDHVAAQWLRDSRAGARDLSTPARRAAQAVTRPLRDTTRRTQGPRP
ncbi:hypothetical protein [Streptomyces sp. NPDC001205]